MKNRLKHMSKTTISVLLSLLMIVSTITVGIVATNAAYTEDDTVGWGSSNYIAIKMDGWSDYTWVQPGQTTTIDISNYYNGDKAYFDLKTSNGMGQSEFWFNIGAGLSATANSSYNYTRNGTPTEGNNRNYFNVGAYGSITVQCSWTSEDSDTIVLKVTAASGSSKTRGVQITGTLNGASRTVNMTQSGSSTQYYYDVTSGTTQTFKFTYNSNTYGAWNDHAPYNLITGNHTSSSSGYGSESNNTHTGNFTFTRTDNHRIWFDTSNYKVWVVTTASNRTVTYGVCTGQTSMGSVTATSGGTSIGESPASVANNSSVTFTATPNFGYSFVGWYDTNATSGGNLLSSNASYTRTISANTTIYARFTANTADPYYLGGRFAVATSSANIHSSTINKNGVDQYGQTLNGGAGLDKSTATAGPNSGTSTNYWTFVEGSTNLKFTLKDGSSSTVGEREYVLNTYRTVKQLSEDKDKLFEDYGGARDDYHNPFYFIIHDKVHRLSGTDSSGGNFQNQNSEANALSLAEYTGNVAESNELRFNNYNSQSNGWVRIHLKENGYNPSTGTGGNPLIWYEIVDETPPAAANVRISATPARVDRNSTATTNVTLKVLM